MSTNVTRKENLNLKVLFPFFVHVVQHRKVGIQKKDITQVFVVVVVIVVVQSCFRHLQIALKRSTRTAEGRCHTVKSVVRR